MTPSQLMLAFSRSDCKQCNEDGRRFRLTRKLIVRSTKSNKCLLQFHLGRFCLQLVLTVPDVIVQKSVFALLKVCSEARLQTETQLDIFSLTFLRRCSYLPSMESLNTFESEMEADGQGNYSLFPALDSIATLSGTTETLER